MSSKTSGRPHVILLASMGWVVRNYLIGDFLPQILEGAALTVLSPVADEADFRAGLISRGVEVEKLLPPPRGWLLRRIEARRELYHFTWCDTASMQVKLQRARSWYSPFHNLRNSLHQRTARVITAMVGQRWLRSYDHAENWVALRSAEAAHYREQFRRLRPSMVFSAAPLDAREWVPVQVARELGIRTAVAILSWDNLSTKNRLPIDFDHYLVWSEKMRKELLHFYPHVRPEQIVVAGTPQFDFYRNPQMQETRAEFCARHGLDPVRPIIMYGGVTPGLMPIEPRVVGRLAEDIRAGHVRGNPQLLLRLHPKDDGSRYRDFLAKHPGVRLEIPGQASRGNVVEWSPSLTDMRELVGTVLHGDVHINVASTLSIDAAVLDRPVVNVRYDLRDAAQPPSNGLMIYDYSHYRPIVASGGVRVVTSPEELVAAVNAYLADPALDRTGRRKIVDSECGAIDGRAGLRIARQLLAWNGATADNDRDGVEPRSAAREPISAPAAR